MKLPYLTFNFDPHVVANHKEMAATLAAGEERHASTNFSTLDEIAKRKTKPQHVQQSPRIRLRAGC